VLKIPEKVSGVSIHLRGRIFDKHIINRRFRLQKATFFISLGRFLVFGPSWHGRCNMSCEPDESSSTNPNQTLRRIIMLTIKDLAVSKSLDSKEMTAVRGGSNYASSYQGGQAVLGGYGPSIGVQANTQTTNQLEVHPVSLDFKSFSFGY
jgi:hypothetical protein